jgi:hypothetical protein
MKKLFALVLVLVLSLSISAAVVYGVDDPDPHVVKPVTEKM